MNKPVYSKEGIFSFNLDYLIDDMDCEAKLHLIDRLSIEGEVIKMVADQILTGWTELGSSAGRSYPVKGQPHYELEKAVRAVAIQSNEVAKKEIECLQKQLTKHEETIRKLNEENHKIREYLKEVSRPSFLK